MWVPQALVDIFNISKDTVDLLRTELAATRAERDALKLQLASSMNHFDWLRVRVNQLEVERAQLLKKAYNIETPIPELVRSSPTPDVANQFSFEDLGDAAAKVLGLPSYDS